MFFNNFYKVLNFCFFMYDFDFELDPSLKDIRLAIRYVRERRGDDWGVPWCDILKDGEFQYGFRCNDSGDNSYSFDRNKVKSEARRRLAEASLDDNSFWL
jgi:hypothetical protein